MPLRRLVHDGTELTNAEQTMVTFSANLTQGGAVVEGITLSNRSANRIQVTVHFRASGASATEANTIFEEYIPPHRTVTAPGGPWWADSSAILSAVSDSATSKVGVHASCFEEYIAGSGF